AWGPPTPAGQKFCGECGAPLTAASTSAPPAATRPGSPTPAPSVPSAPPVAAPAPPRAEPAVAAAPLPSPGPGAAFQGAAPASYTPQHLAEKILTSKGALAGERKTVAVMFSGV